MRRKHATDTAASAETVEATPEQVAPAEAEATLDYERVVAALVANNEAGSTRITKAYLSGQAASLALAVEEDDEGYTLRTSIVTADAEG